MGNMSLLGKVSLGIAFLLSLFALSAIGSAFVQKEEEEIRRASERTTHLLRHVNRATRHLYERQYEMRQILFAPSITDTAAFDLSNGAWNDTLAQIIRLEQDDALQQSRLDRVQDLDRTWMATTSGPVIQAMKESWARTGSVPLAERERIFTSVLANARTSTPELIAVMDQIGEAARSNLIARESALQQTETLRRWFTYGSLVLALLCGACALYLLGALITQPLRHLSDLMTRLAGYDHDIDIPQLQRKDEVGVIARALLEFKKMAIETSDQNWIKTGVAAVSNRLQQVETRQEFAQRLLEELAPHLNAGVGALYLYDESQDALQLLGGYSLKVDQANSSYRVGESLVGQCAAERKPLVFNELPSDYLNIESGTGRATPRYLVLLPILAKDRLLGVIEMAGFTRLTERQHRLLAVLAPQVALSLENIIRAVRTQELLVQTQLQTSELRASEEELRTQQEELQASNEELRQKSDTLNQQKTVLENLQRETQEKAEALTRANQYKSEFLANMSHELRTPLNSLLILSNDLAENGDGNLSEDQVESARIIHDSGSNLLRLINDILDLSKIEAGKMELILEPIDLKRFAAGLKRNFNRVAQEKQVEFTTVVDDGTPDDVVGDSGKLEQIATNLLSNAFKFTRQGAVRMRIGRPLRDYPGFPAHTSVAIEVSDTGIGIPADKLGRVFGAFEQVDASTSRQFGGTGLGLAISRQLVKLHHGDIVLSSEPGQGSVFTILLPETQPVSDEAPAARPRTEAPAPAPRPLSAGTPAPAPVLLDDDSAVVREGDTTILVIEDDLAFARILMDLIRRKGYRALVATDGEYGLQLARKFRPTGILLDVMLPSMDGWTVIEHLKADDSVRHIPVHFISALDESAKGRELGAVGFLTKPVTSDALTGAFDRLLHFSADKTRRLLVVDDDVNSRAAVRKLLASSAVEVLEAETAEQALPMLDEGTVDCIVLDLGLPGMSGFDFLEKMSAEHASIPVVVYSARELTREESLKIRQYTDSIVIKGVRSPERLLDEVSLFLHSIHHQAGAPIAEHGEDLTGRKVLIVDDDMRNIFALSKVLRAKGLDVSLAQDGQRALRLLDEKPDMELVLMDVMMPVMDGYETTRQIRKDPRFAKLPIISLTAKAMRGDREKSLESGASDYLSKPIDIAKLLSMMRVWLHK